MTNGPNRADGSVIPQEYLLLNLAENGELRLVRKGRLGYRVEAQPVTEPRAIQIAQRLGLALWDSGHWLVRPEES